MAVIHMYNANQCVVSIVHVNNCHSGDFLVVDKVSNVHKRGEKSGEKRKDSLEMLT